MSCSHNILHSESHRSLIIIISITNHHDLIKMGHGESLPLKKGFFLHASHPMQTLWSQMSEILILRPDCPHNSYLVHDTGAVWGSEGWGGAGETPWCWVSPSRHWWHLLAPITTSHFPMLNTFNLKETSNWMVIRWADPGNCPHF